MHRALHDARAALSLCDHASSLLRQGRQTRGVDGDGDVGVEEANSRFVYDDRV